MPDQALLNKIRALLAKAQADGASDAERDIFLAKAQELMEKHQVELFQLHVNDPIGMTDGVVAQSGPPKYKADVQVALALYYGLHPVLSRRGKHIIVRLCGPESARITVELLTPFVWAQVCDRAGTLAASGRCINKAAGIREIAKALQVRLWHMTEAKKAQPAQEGTSFSLVVVNATEAFLAQQFPKLKEGRERTISTGATARELAATISVSQQVSNRNQLRLQ